MELVCVGMKKMRASVGVNWHLGCSSRNAKAVKNGKRALKHIFFLNFSLVRFFCFKTKGNEHPPTIEIWQPQTMELQTRQIYP